MAGPHGRHALTRRVSGPSSTQTIEPRDGSQDNLGPYLNRVIWTLVGLATLFLGLRIYAKLLRRRNLWWDDHVLVASWVALVASAAFQSAAVSHGLGKHYDDIGYLTPDYIAVNLYSIIAGFCSILATCWSKTSFAMSLLRIAEGRVRIFIWFIIITVNLVLGSNGVVQWVQCWPVRRQWHKEIEGTCFPPAIVQDYNAFVAAYSGVMDIVLAVLPWKIIWTVAINKREKLAALVAMSVGIISGIMPFLKIMTLESIGNDNDTNVKLFIFGTAEPATLIMGASIPILRALIRPDRHSKPAQFIELDHNNRLKPLSSIAPVSSNDGNIQHSEEDWHSRISNLEEARTGGSSDMK